MDGIFPARLPAGARSRSAGDQGRSHQKRQVTPRCKATAAQQLRGIGKATGACLGGQEQGMRIRVSRRRFCRDLPTTAERMTYHGIFPIDSRV